MNINQLLNHKDIITFLAIALILAITYLIFSRWVKKSNFAIDHKRRLTSNFRGFFTLSLILSALLIWSGEIYSVILPFTAVAAAIAIVSKEFLLCIGGGFYKAIARPFSVGDRIEVDLIRGDVVEFGFLSTQLMEVGPKDYTHQYTGRFVTIPNSIFLTKNVINETFSTDYVLHVFIVPIKKDSNWEQHKEELLKAAIKNAKEHVDQATRHFSKLTNRRQLDMPKIHPRVSMKITDVDKIDLVVRVTVPSYIRGRIEQSIVNDYLKSVVK